jgi:hypothetical protein
VGERISQLYKLKSKWYFLTAYGGKIVHTIAFRNQKKNPRNEGLVF